jgi:methionyl-tRNA formyltransferase
MGTPEFSVNALREIIKAGHEIVAVYSQPPRPSGRGQMLRNSPVHQAALEYNIPVFTPKSLKNIEEQQKFSSLEADIAVVVAYGLLLPKAIIEACYCINIHASLLPKWRGAAPIHRSIMAGDEKTGITIMKMDEGLDTGDMLMVEEVDITSHITTGILHDELSIVGAKLVVKALDKIGLGEITPVKQHGSATYASKIMKEEAHIDWNLSGEQMILNIRAFNPYPGAYFKYKGEKIKILEADFVSNSEITEVGKILDENFAISCGDGKIIPKVMQRQGKKAMPINELLRGFKVEVDCSISHL